MVNFLAQWLDERSDGFLLSVLVLVFLCLEALSTGLGLLIDVDGLQFNLTQGVVGGLAAMIAVVSYRYTVRSNLRGTIGEVEPLVRSGYKLKPTLYAVKWRPERVQQWFEIKTVIRIYIYEIDDNQSYQKPINGANFVEKEISSSNQELLNCTDLRPDWRDIICLDADFKIQSDEEGLRITCFTTNEKQVRKATDHMLRKINDEMESPQSKVPPE